MAQAKKKTSTKTAKRSTGTGTKKCTKKCSKKGMRYERYERGQKSNMFFVISMSVLAATLLFADILMIVA